MVVCALFSWMWRSVGDGERADAHAGHMQSEDELSEGLKAILQQLSLGKARQQR
jgi:hypothetical protein